jgi:prepilin-type N-terminal cleavage/methylation domain-containing protein/prepilin-type processing-associated H-X9-DG protein
LRAAFTLIELLVVVAIIALLISILLPSLQQARERAKAAACGSNVRQMGLAMEQYLLDNQEYYPGEHSVPFGGRAYNVWAPRLRLYASLNEKLFWCPAADDATYWKVVLGVPRLPLNVRGYGYQPTEKPLRTGWSEELFCYGYNSWGVFETFGYPGLILGLGAHVDDYSCEWVWNVRRRDVACPADMIAIADSQADSNWDTAIDPDHNDDTEWPSARHFGGAMVLFCDGHVVWELQSKLVEPTEWTRRRWNNDHEPHREFW